jgi:hypothetical protein
VLGKPTNSRLRFWPRMLYFAASAANLKFLHRPGHRNVE